MTKAYIIEFAKSCNFEMDKEVEDLSGNTFFFIAARNRNRFSTYI